MVMVTQPAERTDPREASALEVSEERPQAVVVPAVEGRFIPGVKRGPLTPEGRKP